MNEDIQRTIDYLEWVVALPDRSEDKREGESGGELDVFVLDIRLGLCSNVINNTDLILTTKLVDWTKWEEYSGNKCCPVKAPDGSHPVEYFKRRELSKYAGEYGEARIRLARWIIKELKNK